MRHIFHQRKALELYKLATTEKLIFEVIYNWQVDKIGAKILF